MMPQQITYPAVVEDADGRVFQFLPDTRVPMYDWESEREWVHSLGGWMDLSGYPVDVSHIHQPVKVVWAA